MRTEGDLILEPYAVKVKLEAGDDFSAERWEQFLCDILGGIAGCCGKIKNSVIGHIKAIALFENNRYLRVSVVSSSYAAEKEGNPPDFFRSMEITLNVLVYGVRSLELSRLTSDCIREKCNRHLIKAKFITSS